MLFALALLQRVIFSNQFVPAADRCYPVQAVTGKGCSQPAQGPGPVGMIPTNT